MDWRTKVTDLLGCRYPIIEGSFAGFGTSALAAPVCQAGGFGLITAGALRTPDRLREDIRKLKSVTDQPFGVNLSMGHCPHIDDMREVAIEEGAAAIETSVYNAAQHGKRIKEAGLVWFHKVATMKHALAAESHGADAVVMVGIEGVGEKSSMQVSTMTSITVAVRRLRVPLIAAGGIGDARGLLAALAMGAEAIYMGTAFMATDECPISPRYKQAMVDADPFDPKVRDRVFAPPDPKRDIKLRRGEDLINEDGKEGWEEALQEWDENTEFRVTGGSMAVGVLDRVKPVKELIDDIIQEAEGLLNREGPLKKGASS
ncbi:MAG: nitronate monooxygenase [Desulfobacterales bacterium]